jgi:hypothetical protein
MDGADLPLEAAVFGLGQTMNSMQVAQQGR